VRQEPKDFQEQQGDKVLKVIREDKVLKEVRVIKEPQVLKEDKVLKEP
jgi:hypothetical protein